jgi:hypothetical protein
MVSACTGIERFTLDSVDTEVVKNAVAWFEAGHRATLATVIRTWGSAPRPIGALTAIRDDGMVVGSVSGTGWRADEPSRKWGPPGASSAAGTAQL